GQRERDRERERGTEREGQREIERETERERQRERERERERDRERDAQRERERDQAMKNHVFYQIKAKKSNSLPSLKKKNTQTHTHKLFSADAEQLTLLANSEL